VNAQPTTSVTCSAWIISDALQWVRQPYLHAQPRLNEQQCARGLGDAACFSARVLLMFYLMLPGHRRVGALEAPDS
jgi:hypothetical protein